MHMEYPAQYLEIFLLWSLTELSTLWKYCSGAGNSTSYTSRSLQFSGGWADKWVVTRELAGILT